MTEELKPNGHQKCKRSPSSGNAASRRRRTPEQREESSGGAAESGENQRVQKTPKDREWRDDQEEERERLHRKRSSSIKRGEVHESPMDGPDDQPEPLGHPLTQSRKAYSKAEAINIIG
ncbi:hypothetical protein M9H77_14097 [Catharanthus roseus]|uniref:Uncharacterized protein n=1 Tax=Catharanthus roseus TaxID=4058 RepID=A0ACC0BM83_CATRO|nr:hypothetical protein M9H77_14097 [Catharanthus roseus]